MVKYFCVDLGTKTMGIARSDILGIAHPFGEFRFDNGNYKSAREHLIKICLENNIFNVVIGYPLQIDREKGVRCLSVDKFISDTNLECQDIKFYRFDESYSTIEARERLKECGYNEKKIMQVIDMYSAVVILEDFLKNYKGDEKKI